MYFQTFMGLEEDAWKVLKRFPKIPAFSPPLEKDLGRRLAGN
jgi:hypothetical protein